MARGAIARYSSRNLDACTLQLGSWDPFVAMATEPDPSDVSVENLLETENLGKHRSLSSDSSDIRDGKTTGVLLAPMHFVKCSFKQMPCKGVGTDRWPCPVLRNIPRNQNLESNHVIEDTDMALESSTVMDILGVNGSIAEELTKNGGRGASNSSDCDKISVLSPGLSGWSRRQKQLSRALARGLWRWREGSRSRKRRRKGGSSRSVSGRSSDSRRARMYASDPTTVGASVACATCSDIPPMPGTDSSGELFFYGDCVGISWDPELLSGSDGIAALRRDGMELYHAWLTNDAQSLESGYGSEPGYRGDGELGYEDDGVADEQDEEEREQLPLSPWRESTTKTELCTIELVPEDEDCQDDLTSSSDLKLQHRLRRRRQDCKVLGGQKSRHF